MLACRCSADTINEYLRLGESTTLKCLRKFCSVIEAVCGQWYLRLQNPADLYRLLHMASRRLFPSMLGSLDCMHWEWDNYPIAWACQFTGYQHKPTIVLKAVASYDTWMWHAFFGVVGSNNDINVLAHFPLFNDVVNGVSPHIQYIVNRNEYNLGYYLADGIYPSWATLVNTISQLHTPKKYYLSKNKRLIRRMSKAFRILQAQWEIVRGPACMWRKE
ncbi:unnamed protein product [Prunus armeniaca]